VALWRSTSRQRLGAEGIEHSAGGTVIRGIWYSLIAVSSFNKSKFITQKVPLGGI